MTEHHIDLGHLLASLRREHLCIASVTVDRTGADTIERIARLALDVFVESVHLVKDAELQQYLATLNFDPPESPQTTRQLAVQAFRRAAVKSMSDPDANAIGIAISRITQSCGHLVMHSRRTTSQCTFQTSNYSASLIDPLRQITLNMLSQHMDGTAARKLVLPDELTTTWAHEHGRQQWQELIHGQSRYFGDCPERPVMFSGSFNPLHQGHRQMVDHASSRLSCRVHLEISVTNADKPELDYLTIKHRAGQAETLGPVVLTRAPKFLDKSLLFPGATFLIGADTAMRLDDIRFYNNSVSERETALAKIGENQCRFLVFGRLVEQSFCEASSLSLSPRLRSLCEFVPAIDFRVDVSSREIRERRQHSSE